MLLDTIPDLEMTGRQRMPVAGRGAEPDQSTVRLRLQSALPLANDRCRSEVPASVTDAFGTVACHAVTEGRLAA
jgi:hypothetical protein